MSHKADSVKPAYRCAHCGGVFVSGWSHAAANAEARAQWGVAQASDRADMAVLCEDCHQHVRAWLAQTEGHA